MTGKDRTTERVRHNLRFRIAEVSAVERLTPRMTRLTFTAPEFAEFASDAYDDHVKVFFWAEGETPALPMPGENGLEFPGRRPEGRDYTPRSFSRERQELVIDFVLHGDGPASTFAENAKVGDRLGIGGPRGSFVVHGPYDWYLLVGDATALPAIGRRLEELPADAKVLAFIEVASQAEQQDLRTPTNTSITWIHGGEGRALIDAVKAATIPEGVGYTFIAGESATSHELRTYLLEDRGFDPDHIKSAGYWRRGESDFYDGHAH